MIKKQNHNYVLIMAGGSGTRLYPRSTDELPKQFQKIVGEKTLFEETYDRVTRFVEPENIYISSNHKYVDLIQKYLPKVPKKNYITEPVKRNTGPAIALATALIYKKDPKAIIVATHSDHLVTKVDDYKKGVLAGINTIVNHSNYVLCIGVKPTSPHTGYGYIERKEEFRISEGHMVYNTSRFVEKPNLELAKEYLSSGNFFWNTGYFIWQAEHFLNELKTFSPDIYKGVNKIVKTEKTEFKKVLDKEFTKFPDIAVDNMIMEKTENLLVLPVDIGWSDVGSWDVVSDMLGSALKDDQGNYKEGNVICIDTHNTTILSHDNKKVVATIGLDNFIVVTTEEAIVVVPKGRSEDIKKIVEKLKDNK